MCGLQEVRRLSRGSAAITTNEIKRKYEVFLSGHTLKRQHGVAIAVKIDPNVELIEVIQLNARVIVLDVVLYGCSMRVINCYAPTEDYTNSTRNSFYNQLHKQFVPITNKQKVISLSDFNATYQLSAIRAASLKILSLTTMARDFTSTFNQGSCQY